jgi:hypothetical protein
MGTDAENGVEQMRYDSYKNERGYEEYGEMNGFPMEDSLTYYSVNQKQNNLEEPISNRSPFNDPLSFRYSTL